MGRDHGVPSEDFILKCLLCKAKVRCKDCHQQHSYHLSQGIRGLGLRLRAKDQGFSFLGVWDFEVWSLLLLVPYYGSLSKRYLTMLTVISLFPGFESSKTVPKNIPRFPRDGLDYVCAVKAAHRTRVSSEATVDTKTTLHDRTSVYPKTLSTKTLKPSNPKP